MPIVPIDFPQPARPEPRAESTDASPPPDEPPDEPRADALFQSRTWMRALNAAYAFDFHRAVLPGSRADDRPSLPFAVMNSALRRRVISLPFSDYVDTGSMSPEECRQLLDQIREAYPQAPLLATTTYPHDTDGLGQVDRTAFYHRVPTPSHDAVDDGMRSSFSRNVRQARREGVTTHRSTSAPGMATFYDLHKALRFGKFGKIPQPQRFFRALREAFLETGNGFLLQARREGRVIASALVLQHRDVLYYKFGASAKDALEYRPNNLLFHTLLHDAVDAGCRAVDLGLSGTGDDYAGLRRFKESFGGVPHPVTRFRINPPDHDAAAEAELNELLGSLTRAVVEHDLDDDATDAISSIVYPYFA